VSPISSRDDGVRLPKSAPFAPNTPSDNRRAGEWKTRYADTRARRAIVTEAIFVWGYLLLALVATVAVALETQLNVLPIPAESTMTLAPYVLSFHGGFIGGTLFSMKWLYHTVARGIWNHDRRLWRIFTPLLSAGAAVTVVLLCASGVLPFFGPDLVRSLAGSLGLSIVFGYFSDRAFSALGNVMTGIGMPALAASPNSTVGGDTPDSKEADNEAGLQSESPSVQDG
jgi:hypothetical protein